MRVLLIATAFLAAFAGIDAKCWPVRESCVDSTAEIFINTINNGANADEAAAFPASFICAFNQHGIHWHGAAEDVTQWLQKLIDTFGLIFSATEPEEIIGHVNDHWSSFQALVNTLTGNHLAEYVNSPMAQDFLSQVVPWKDQLLQWAEEPESFAANAQGGGEIYKDLVSKFVTSLKAFNEGSCAAATAQLFINAANNGPDLAIEQNVFPGSFICAFDQADIQWLGLQGDVESWLAQLLGTFARMFDVPDTGAINMFLDDHWRAFEQLINVVTGERRDDYVAFAGAQDFLEQVVAWREQLRTWAAEPESFGTNAKPQLNIYKELVPKFVKSLKEFMAA